VVYLYLHIFCGSTYFFKFSNGLPVYSKQTTNKNMLPFCDKYSKLTNVLWNALEDRT